MVPPLPPAASPADADTLAGSEGMDFDALDFSFLDDEGGSAPAEPSPAPEAASAPASPADEDEAVGNTADGDDFDLAAWDAAEADPAPVTAPAPAAAPEASPAASPEAAAADFDFDGGFGADDTPAPAPAEVPAEAEDDPFALPEPEEPAFGTGAPTAFEDGAEPAFALDGEDEAPLDAAPEEATPEETDAEEAEPARPAGPRKYLFDRSFDYVPPPPPPPEPDPVPETDPEPEEESEIEAEAPPEPDPEPEEPPPPPPPTFSEEELAAARASSYADGETAGLQTAMATIEARSSRALEAIGQQVPGILADRQQVVDAVAHEAARLAYALVARMMPELARTYGLGEIEAVVRDSLGMAVDQPRLSIRVHPDIAVQLHPRLEGMALNAGFNGQISLLADADLGPSDVRVEWGDGGAERLIRRAWDDVTEIVRRSVADLKERTGAGVADESAVVQGYETASP